MTCHFHLAAIIDFGERKNGNHFFLNPHVSKNIRSNAKLLLTDISHEKYTVSCTQYLLGIHSECTFNEFNLQNVPPLFLNQSEGIALNLGDF